MPAEPGFPPAVVQRVRPYPGLTEKGRSSLSEGRTAGRDPFPFFDLSEAYGPQLGGASSKAFEISHQICTPAIT